VRETPTVPRSRIVLVAVLVLLLLVVVAVGRPFVQQQLTNRQPVPVAGRLLLPTDTGLVVYDLAARREAPLIPTPQGEIVSAAAWSPDGLQVAYGLFHRRPGDPASVSEIYLAAADGSGQRPLAERDRPGAILDTPVWSPDGREVYFSYFGQVATKPVQRIERVRVATGERETVVEDGYAPAVSPDGQSLLFLRDERAGTGLWLVTLAGGQPTAVLPPGRYPSLAVPRFSPDGKRVTAAIINVSTAQGDGQAPFAWLLPPVVYAHGLPWDIWTFGLQGDDMRRLTNVNADDPSPVWSPDGRYIAFWGGTGLYLVAADGSDLRQVLDKGGYGAIDWAR
jgi:Tol biopolymer transport system component